MTEGPLSAIAQQLVANNKGLLALDESSATCNRRFAAFGIAQTAENRRRWRDLVITVPRLNESISGIILYDETIRQADDLGRPFLTILSDADILVGIKVDVGAQQLAGFPGESVTEGLDGLRARLQTYREMGARFAKWRAVLTVAKGMPSRGCIEANAHALARFAALCQEAGLVPVVEPELLMVGRHDMEVCGALSETILKAVFNHLSCQKVLLEGMILKPNMVLPGLTAPYQQSVELVADATIQCLRRAVPAAVPGIAFLSGGQSPELASARLNAMNGRSGAVNHPWPLTFSYGRGIQQPALALWLGDNRNKAVAQAALLHRAACNSAARRGQYLSIGDTYDS